MSERHRAAPRTAPTLLQRGIAWLLVFAFALPGCVTQPISVITLSGVVRNGTVYAGAVPVDAVQLTRGEHTYAAVTEMELLIGDMLRTGHDTGAVVSYPGGARAYIYPNTQVRIGSIIDDIGKVFVRVQGYFTVRTDFVTAGSEGTEYWVNVSSREDVKVVVVKDTVRLESSAGAWPATRLLAGQQAQCRGNAPAVLSTADPADIRRETDWVEMMDKQVPVKMTVSKAAMALGAALAVGIAVGGFKSGDSRTTQQPAGVGTHPQ
jgi:hypothetical protein